MIKLTIVLSNGKVIIMKNEDKDQDNIYSVNITSDMVGDISIIDVDFDDVFYITNYITTSSTSNNTITLNTPDVVYSDVYTELRVFEEEEEKDEKLRKEHSVLQEAYDEYLLIKKLVEDQEIDKSFEQRYDGFKEP